VYTGVHIFSSPLFKFLYQPSEASVSYKIDFIFFCAKVARVGKPAKPVRNFRTFFGTGERLPDPIKKFAKIHLRATNSK